MKKKLLIALSVAACLPAFADLTGNGYYRVENYVTERWAEVVDNQAIIDWGATNVEVHAVQLQKNFDAVVSNPASVLYINNIGGTQYDIEAQGTSIQQIIDYFITLTDDAGSANGEKLYYAYATAKGVTRFLGDGNYLSTVDISEMVTNASGNYRKWYIKPISENGDNYFGAALDISCGGRYYSTLYASFPYTPTVSKAYYIRRVDHGMAEMIEITGTIPGGTPVIIEGNRMEPTNNRMVLGGYGTVPSGNSLQGAYFDYDKNGFKNYVTYDKNTMRVLGTCSDGSLGFVTASGLLTIPANTAYIRVPEGSPEEFKCVSTAEFDAWEPPTPPEPQKPEALYVVGNFNGWTTPAGANTYVKLDKIGENTYSGTISYDKEGQLDFKVFDEITSDWTHAYGVAMQENVKLEQNVAYTWTMAYGDNTQNFSVINWGGASGTITVDIENNTLSIVTSTIQYESPYPKTLWLVGNFNDWNASDKSYLFTQTEEGMYSGEFNLPAVNDVNGLLFKVTAAEDWSVNYGASGSENYNFNLYSDYDVNTPVFATGANWAITNWAGGKLIVSLNLVDMTIELAGPDQPDSTPEEDYVYMVGSMNSWNFNSSDYVIPSVEEGIYSGYVDLPEGNLYFRFYTELGNQKENCLSPSETGGNLKIVFEESDTFTSPFYEVYNNGTWFLSGWGGGNLKVTLDMNNSTVSFFAEGSKVESVIESDSAVLSYRNGVVSSPEAREFTVFNPSGKVVARSYGNSIDISHLAKGIYVVVADGVKPLKVMR